MAPRSRTVLARTPTSSSSSRRAVISGASPSTSRVPAGISRRTRFTGPRYWRTRRTVSRSVTGTTATAPGWRTTSRVKRVPSGDSYSPWTTEIPHPWRRTSSARWRNPCSGGGTDVGVDGDEPWQASVGAAQGGSQELSEQGVGTVGSALELRVGLGPHPEGVIGKLDELDEHAVGGGSRAA